MAGPLPYPGRTGVRIAGDHYQWLHAWGGCLQVLADASDPTPNPVVAVGVEVDDTGNLDDVVLFRQRPPHSYAQVKYAVDAATPVNTEFLTNLSDRGGPSVLQKIATAWAKLTEEGDAVDLAIVTNRTADHGDVLLAGRDARTGLLLPRAAEQGAKSARGKQRAIWAAHTGLPEPALLELLSVLRFDVGRDLGLLTETTALRMLVAGIRANPAAIEASAAWVAQQVRNGYRRFDIDAIRCAVDDLALRQGPDWAPISVATLKPDPLAADAVHALDWVDRFAGSDAFTKRRPAPPATWAQLQADIEAIPAAIYGHPRVVITGSLRQATAFAVGASLRMVTGADVGVVQRGSLWQSLENYGDVAELAETPFCPIGQGPDVAVAIEVAAAITDDVTLFLREQRLPVDRLVVLRPRSGSGDGSVPDGRAANALAVAMRNAVRSAVRGAPRVHLFLAGPMALALLLGHRWNRIAPTTVYEDLKDTYDPAFTINA